MAAATGSSLEERLHDHDTRWSAGRMLVARAGSLFDADGNLTDEATRERLREFIAGFAAFIER